MENPQCVAEFSTEWYWNYILYDKLKNVRVLNANFKAKRIVSTYKAE
jgi:hypothetical protein